MRGGEGTDGHTEEDKEETDHRGAGWRDGDAAPTGGGAGGGHPGLLRLLGLRVQAAGIRAAGSPLLGEDS